MQPQEQNPGEQAQPQQNADWQQPAAPAVDVMPAQTVAPPQTPAAPQDQQVQQPVEQPMPQAYAAAEPASVDTTGMQPQVSAPEEADSLDESSEQYSGDEGLVRWQATEHIHREKSAMWYGIFALIVVVLIALAIFLVQSWTFAILVPVMAATLIIYAQRPPSVIEYTLSRKGLHVNDKLYSFELFKEFGLIHDDDENAVMLVPRKRFQPGITVYFPDEAGEAIVDMLASRLPMHELRLDPIDRLIRRLHI